MSYAGRWRALLMLTTLGACTPRQRAPRLDVEVQPLPIIRRDGVHELGLGVWAATLWGSGNIRVQGTVDLVSNASTVPFAALLGHELPATAHGMSLGMADTFFVQLGFAPDPPGAIQHDTYSDDGSVSLHGRRLSADTVRGEWFEQTYGGGRSGIFLLVRCPTHPPSNYCMQQTRAPSH